LTDQELAAEEKKKLEDHADRVTDFDSMPAALKNNSTRPRYHGAVQKYKCACEDISGIYCQECEGEDPCCEVCLCECNIGPVTKNQFQAISRATQSKAKGWKENEAVQTDQEKEASFGGVITNALAVSDVSHSYSCVILYAITLHLYALFLAAVSFPTYRMLHRIFGVLVKK
jgi:hypothetical protein